MPALNPSTLSGYTCGIAPSYFGSQLFSDTALTTPATNGGTIGGVNVDGSGDNFLQSSANSRPTARLGGSGLNGNDLIDALITGTPDQLLGGPASTYVANNAFTFMWLMRPRSITQNSGTVTSNDGLISTTTNNRLGIYLRNDTQPVLQSYVNDGATKSANKNITVGAWALCAMRLRNGVLSITNGDGVWASVACGNVLSLTQTLRMFSGAGGTNNFDGELPAMLIANVGWTDSMLDRAAIDFFQSEFTAANAPWTRFSPAPTVFHVGGGFNAGAFNDYGFNDELGGAPAITSDVATAMHRIEVEADVTNTPAAAVTSDVATALQNIDIAASATNTAPPAVTSDVATALHRIEIEADVTNTPAAAVTSDVATALHRIEVAASVTNTPAPAITGDVATALQNIEVAASATNTPAAAVTSDVATALHRIEIAASVTNTPAPAITSVVDTDLHRIEIAAVTVTADPITSDVATALHRIDVAASVLNVAPGAINAQVATALHRIDVAADVTNTPPPVTSTVATRLHRIDVAAEAVTYLAIVAYVDTSLHRIVVTASARTPIATLPITGICSISDELAAITCVSDELASGECSVSDSLACIVCISEHDVAGECSVSDELSAIECVSDT